MCGAQRDPAAFSADGGTELAAVLGHDLGEQFLPSSRKSDGHHPAVIRMRRARDETRAFQCIDQTGDRGAGHTRAIGQFSRRERRLATSPLAVAPQRHQHAEPALGNLMLGQM
jgi:hypothetical protein